MEDDHGNSATTAVDTAKAERLVWLMKCPLLVSKSWQSQATASSSDTPPVAKVVVSLDLIPKKNPDAPADDPPVDQPPEVMFSISL